MDFRLTLAARRDLGFRTRLGNAVLESPNPFALDAPRPVKRVIGALAMLIGSAVGFLFYLQAAG